MFTIENDILYFVGDLTEIPPAETFNAEFKKSIESLDKGEDHIITTSFERVGHINSVGVRKLIKVLRDCERTLNFVNSPVWLVDQFNMINGFFGEKHFATSFYCPYYSESSGDEHFHLISIATDFDLGSSFTVQSFSDIEHEKVVYSPDFESSSYFAFLLPLEQRIRSYIESQAKNKK